MRAVAAVLLVCVGLSAPQAVAQQAGVDFERDVVPVLIRRCLECHQGSEPAGGLRLNSAAGLHQGGDSGAAVQSASPDQSYLLQRVRDGEMPPAEKGQARRLPETETRILEGWIASGAEWPETRQLDLYEVTTDVRGGRDWWAFQPVQRPAVPVIQGVAAANPIDAFIRQRLLSQGLQPAPPAEPAVLVRRLYYSVTGLPPTAQQVQRWSADAVDPEPLIAELIEELLSSPHFGERWARYWLDLVRYAETSGYERDQPKPFAWKYRDWVVQAINDDMPYDQFVKQQLAGDEIPGRSLESVIATGFLRFGTWNDEPNDDADYQYERLEDMVHATSSAFLGLTVKCARCHDHKFDPIPQHDYYRLASVFWPGPISARKREWLGGPTAAELGYADVLGWTDLAATAEPLHVLKNGERQQPLYPAVPGTLTFAKQLATDFAAPATSAGTTQRRLQLANWIADPRHPLTARVQVNRIWLHHFGEGLVRTPNNFGFKGDLPTHPQLLDWLADEFVSSGWSARHIHRLILTSATWQQSSLHPESSRYAQHDSANQFWWRANRRRLDAESLRDRLLAVSGQLDLSVGGESFRPAISAEALEGLSRRESAYQASEPELQRRRTLYAFVSRSLMPPLLTTFDQCDTTLPCGQRDVTTVPTQALALLNNEFVHDCSQALADRVLQHSEGSAEADLKSAWLFALGRQPQAAELSLARQHLQDQIMQNGLTPRQALESVCHVLVNSNEFLYVD